MNYNRLKNTVESSKLSITALCKKLDIDRKTFYNNIENKTLKVETLEKICAILELNISDFFTTNEKTYSLPEGNHVLNEPESVYRAVDYKEKYYQTLEALNETHKKLNEANERLLAFTDIKKDLIKPKKHKV